MVAPASLRHARARVFGVEERRADGVHFGRGLSLAPGVHGFGRHGTVHVVSVGVVDSTHAPRLGHPLSSFSGECKTAPAGTSDEQNTAHYGQRDGKGQFPPVETAAGTATVGRRGGTCYECFVEDGGRVREECFAGERRLHTGYVQCLQDYFGSRVSLDIFFPSRGNKGGVAWGLGREGGSSPTVGKIQLLRNKAIAKGTSVDVGAVECAHVAKSQFWRGL